MTDLTQTFPPEPSSVRTARQFVATVLADHGLHELADATTSVVSELATNCVIHARTPFTVEVARQGDGVRVSVTDTSPVQARLRSYGVDSTTGRGLRLVASLATTWGVEADRSGKTVWFEVTEGAATRPVIAWDEGVAADADVDALLAAFGDDEDNAVVRLLPRRWTALVAA